MTLIQTVLTAEYVMQVSDRRLTAGGVFRDDTFNKAVAWGFQATVAFSGFAYTDCAETLPVSHWIADTISRHRAPSDGLNALESGAAELVSNLSGCRAKRRLTIVAAGMQIVDDVTMPFVARLSNYEDGRTRFDKEKDYFIRNLFSTPLVENRVQYYVHGIQLKNEELSRVDEELPDIVRNHGPNNVMKYLVGVQRRVADRTNAVGQDAMVAVVPASPTAPVIMSDLGGDEIHTVNTNYSFVKAHAFSTERLFPLCAEFGSVRELVGSTTPDGSESIQVRGVLPPERWSGLHRLGCSNGG